jgi:hypothetical protein
MLQLVMEHLDNEHHRKTVQAIQKESNLLCMCSCTRHDSAFVNVSCALLMLTRTRTAAGRTDVKPPEGAKVKESQLVTLLRLSQIRLRAHYLTTKDIFAPDLRTLT